MNFRSALLSLLCACSAETEHVAVTQVTARIYASDEVRARMAQLRVRSYRSNGEVFRQRTERAFDKEKLEAVVDIALVPAARSARDTVLVVADAIDSDGLVLVQTRATFDFVLREQRVIELWLYPCGLMQLGTLCDDANCERSGCRTCVAGQCGHTPHVGEDELAPLDPDEPPDPRKYPRDHDSGATPSDDAGPERDACADETCAPRPDAGGDAAPPASSGHDASGHDASTGTASDAQVAPAPHTHDAGSDAGRDAGGGPGSDAGFDASMDGGFDAGLDAGRDAGPSDGGSDAAPDTGLDSGPLLEAPGRCAQASAWTPVNAYGAIPAAARVLAGHTNPDGNLPQYICRALAPDGATAPAKVSQNPANAAVFDFGCYGAYLASGSGAWLEFGYDDPGDQFQVLTPPSECVLDWVAVPVNGGLPSRALVTGTAAGGAPLYSCRIPIMDATRNGTHMGRVSAAPGDSCHVQYYGGVTSRASFEVLVQTRP